MAREVTEVSKRHVVTAEYFSENGVLRGMVAYDDSKKEHEWYLYRTDNEGNVASVEKIDSPAAKEVQEIFK